MSNIKVFTWKDFYISLAEKIIDKYNSDKLWTEKELREIMTNWIKKGLLYMDLDSKISEYWNKNIENRIDPFTFFANFNRWINNENRKVILEDLNLKFELWFNDISGDYLVPVVNNQREWFFTVDLDKNDKDIDNLWELFEKWYKWEVDSKLFDIVKDQPVIWIEKLTMWLFWINPDKYISLNKNTRFYLYNRFKIDSYDSEFNFNKYLDILKNKKLKKDWFKKIVSDAYFIIRIKPELIKKADELNNELRNVWISVMDRLKQISIILFWIYLSETENNKFIKDELKYNPEKYYNVEKINKIFEDIRNESNKNYKNEKISAVFNGTKLDVNFEKYINDFIKKLDIEILSNVWNYEWDLFWDLYEYFLKTISDAWNLWEFYTPRHIVDLMVFILKRKWFNLKNDKIYDPTCWTWGFLSYVWQDFKDKWWNEKNIYWNELNWDTQKFALMNMFLHGDWNSNITQWDSLEKSHIEKIKKENIKYIIANPPYWAKGLDSKNILWENWYKDFWKKDLETKTSELLFLQQIFSVLNDWGTAWVVIPEWVNFQSWAAKNIREFLLKNCSEFEVFSLPSWAFMPYTGVKTSFYVFTKKTVKDESCKSVKFFDIKNDGYSLDKKRREISWSDILKIKENYWTKKGFKSLEDEWVLYEQNIEELKKNNFSFSIKKEEKVREYKWEMVDLWKYVELENWYAFSSKEIILSSSNNSKKILKIANIQWWDVIFNKKNTEYVNTNENLSKYIVNIWDLVIAMSWATLGKVWIVNEECYLNQRVWKFIIMDKKVNIEYLYYILGSNYFQKLLTDLSIWWAQPNISWSQILSIKIPLPPLEEQKKIVTKLEKLWDLWKLSRDVYEVLEKIWVESEFFESEKNIDNSIENLLESIDYRWKTPKKTEDWVLLITAKNVKKWYLDFSIKEYISKTGYIEYMTRGIPKKWSILFTTEAPLWNVAILNLNSKIWLAQRIINYNSKNNNELLNKYLYYYFLSNSFQSEIYNFQTWTTVIWIWAKELNKILIKYSKLNTQKQIAKYFHTYFLLKDFIKIFSLNDKNAWNIEILQNKILESFLLWQENENIDVFLNKIENIFEEEKYFEEEILNKVYNKIIDLIDLDSFKIEKNSEIIKNILSLESIDQENIDQIILNLNSLKEYWNNEIFEHLKQNLETILLQKEFNKWEIFNYELYKQIKSLNKTYLDSKKLFKNWTDEDDFEESFIHFNKHLKCIFDTFSKELQTLSQPLNFKFKESRVFSELEKYSSVVLNHLADEIKQNFVFDYSKLKDNASSSKNYIISNDLEVVSKNINKKYYFEKKDILNYYLSLLTKQFVILYWITGIWKSKIASEFPKHIYWEDISWNYFKHIAIKAWWDDDKDIKWYYDNLEQDYREWEMLNIIKKAIIDRGNPYFVLLDEMNISKVEHYLSDFLSYIETISHKDNFISENEINLYNTQILDYLEEIKVYLEKLVIQNTFWNKKKWEENNEKYDKLFDIPEIKKNFYKLLSVESKTWLNLIWDLLENNPIFWVKSLIWSYEDKKILENFIKYIKLQLWENIWEVWDWNMEDYLKFIEENFWDIFMLDFIPEDDLNKLDNYYSLLIDKINNNLLYFNQETLTDNLKNFFHKKIENYEKIKQENKNNNIDIDKKISDLVQIIRKIKSNINKPVIDYLISGKIGEFRDIWTFDKYLKYFDKKQENKNYFSDFIYLSDYNFKKSERSKLSKEEQLVDFKNKLIWKIKEWYSIKLSWSHWENKFKNILSLTLKEIENAKFEIWVRIPDNLYITWTINIDETTEWLSPKVIDRANIIEYNQVHLNKETEFLDFLDSKVGDKEKLKLSKIKPFDFKHESKIYDIIENIWKEELEAELKEQIILLKKIYFITQESNQHFGYRTIEEILKYLWNFKIRILEKNNNDKITSINEYFDLQILQKILPKIWWYNQKTEIVLRKILIELLKIKSWNNNDKIEALNKIKESIQKVVEEINPTNVNKIEKTLAEIIDKDKILELNEIKKIIVENNNHTDKQNDKLVDIFIEHNKSKLLLLDIIENKILELENNHKELKIFKFNENYSFNVFNSEKNQIFKLDSDYKRSVEKIINMLENYYQEGKTSYWI